MSQVLTTGQAAKFCKVTTRTITQWFDIGRIKGYRLPSTKPGGGSTDRRIPVESLACFMRDSNIPIPEELRKLLPAGWETTFKERDDGKA
jgi:hypothetical protein